MFDFLLKCCYSLPIWGIIIIISSFFVAIGAFVLTFLINKPKWKKAFTIVSICSLAFLIIITGVFIVYARPVIGVDVFNLLLKYYYSLPIWGIVITISSFFVAIGAPVLTFLANKPKWKKASTVVSICSLAFLIIITGVFIACVRPVIIVPNVTELPREIAYENIIESKLIPEIIEMDFADGKKDTIKRQYPDYGTPVYESSVIKLYVHAPGDTENNDISSKVTVPRIIGLTYDAAMSQIMLLGLNLEIENYVPSQKTAKDYIVSQFPEEGTKVGYGEVILVDVGWDTLTRTATITSSGSSQLSYHIGIATLSNELTDEEYRGAQALIAKYGSVDNGGRIKHIILPDHVMDEQEKVIKMIAELADDPLIKAIIVNPGIHETAAAFQKIRDTGRDDIFLMTAMPQDDLGVISQVADVVVDQDRFARGYYDILRAKNLGATTFVHMSFPRHMDIYVLARRRAIYEQACKDLGIEFVFVTVPDPVSEIGVASAQQAVYDMMPGMVDKYGTDAVYFTTNSALHEPVKKRVIELGAMFVNQEDMSPLCGFPSALMLDLLTQDVDDWPAMVKKIEADIVAKGAGGRVGTWPISFEYAASIGLGELAMDMIEGRATGNVQNDLVKAFQAVTPGCDWMVQPYSKWVNDDISNYFLLFMDTYIFGKGYSGVLSEPFPEKYYSIDVTY